MFTDMSSTAPTLLAHYDYPTLDRTCNCPVCEDWRQKERLHEEARAVVEGHGRSCMCADCKHMRELARAHHAARNRREVFCEMSYHAGLGDLPDREAAMTWVYAHVMSSEMSDGWWSKRAPYYPMEHWFREAAKGIRTGALAVSGMIVSGAVTIATAVSGAVRQALSPSLPARPMPAEPVAFTFRSSEDLMSSSSTVEAAKKEIAQLEHQLQKDPLFRRMAALKSFVESYVAEHLVPKAKELEATVVPAARRARSVAKKGIAVAESDAEKVVAAARAWLQEHGPAFSKDIAAALTAAGVQVGGKQPGRTIGNLLNKKPGFVYSDKKGFSVADKAA